jgi:hypothetical protein
MSMTFFFLGRSTKLIRQEEKLLTENPNQDLTAFVASGLKCIYFGRKLEKYFQNLY